MESLTVLVTGASGYIGSAVTQALVRRGHRVVGLARSPEATATVRSLGASPLPGSLQDTEVLHAGASTADAVVHTAATNDADIASVDRAAVEALLDGLQGGTFVTTSAAPVTASASTPQTEDQVEPELGPLAWLREAELRVLGASSTRGVVVRPPIVYGDDRGPIQRMIDDAQSSNAAWYIEPGTCLWSAVHVRDLATAYALLAESELTGVFHAAEPQPVALTALATAIGERVAVPVIPTSLDDAIQRHGPLAALLARNTVISSTALMDRTGWATPAGDRVGGLLGSVTAEPGSPTPGS